MNDEDFAAKVAAHCAQLELGNDEPCWWWLSFCDTDKPDGEQFIGVAIVKARSLIEASAVAHRCGCNPGGQMMAVDVPGYHGDPPDEWNHKLITDKARIDELTQQWHGCNAQSIADFKSGLS